MTTRHNKVKLAQKLANLQAAVKDYTDLCERIVEENKAKDKKGDGRK